MEKLNAITDIMALRALLEARLVQLYNSSSHGQIVVEE
jgi:hypothetical protein